MATDAAMLIISVIVFLTTSNVVQGNASLAEIIKKAAGKLEEKLLNHLNNVSQIDVLNQSYNQLTPRGQQIDCIPVAATDLVKEMAAKLDKIFESKVIALRRLKEKAEETAREYNYDSMIKRNAVHFVNMKTFKDDDPSLNYSQHFKQKVNLLESGVHIPLEIFESYPEIQNGLRWSASLDEVFKSNYEENKEIGWQSFGSEAGYMRVYPANKWKEIPDTPDFYDVRRRPWYIQGSTSPKDMLILMDISGSVHGQTFTLMKIAVKTMLNTLEENDYVNVAWFSNKAGWVSCFETFVQANSWNKKVLLDGVDLLKDGNMSSYSKALEFAFQEFNKFNENKTDFVGAECHQVIMLLTDGGTDKPEEVLKQYNQNKTIRIFTYAIGPHAVPVHTIKWIACENKGHFYSISTMGGIKTTVQEYPNILVRPMALSNSQFETWSTVYADAGNLGMVVTVTLPVFNRSTDGNQSSLGVVGIDTPISDIRALTPHEVGPIGFPFAINLNGFAILHPKMNIRRTYLDDAADIDFLDLEGNGSTKEFLRKAMIDGKEGYEDIRTFVITDNDYHIVQKQMIYAYAPMVNGSFSLGLAVPDDRKCFMRIKGIDTTRGLAQLNHHNESLLAYWEFCKGIIDGGNTSDFEQRLSEQIMNNVANCDSKLVQHLLWDIDRTRKIVERWKRTAEIEKTLSVFLGTEGGLTRFYPSEESATFANFRDPFGSTYFKKAYYYSGWTFLNEKQLGLNDTEASTSVITVVRAVADGSDKSLPTYYNPAVVGVRLNETIIEDYFDQTACKDKHTLTCYLLDDGGFIVSTNQESTNISTRSKVGDFLGNYDVHLMKKLINMTIYREREEYEYHADCIRHEIVLNSATKFTNLMRSTASLVQKGFHSIVDTFLLLASGWTVTSDASSDEKKFTNRTIHYSCTKVRTRYYFKPNWDLTSSDSDVTCGNCSRKFSAIHLRKTNLLLVIVRQPACPMVCPETAELQHKIHQSEGPDICGKDPRYRRRPRHPCFASHPLENTSVCGAANRVPSSNNLFVIFTILLTAWLSSMFWF